MVQSCCTGRGTHHEESLPQVKYSKQDLNETKEERKQRKYRYLYQVGFIRHTEMGQVFTVVLVCRCGCVTGMSSLRSTDQYPANMSSTLTRAPSSDVPSAPSPPPQPVTSYCNSYNHFCHPSHPLSLHYRLDNTLLPPQIIFLSL